MRDNGKVGDVRYAPHRMCLRCKGSHDRVKFTRCEPFVEYSIDIYWWGICPVTHNVISRAVVREEE